MDVDTTKEQPSSGSSGAGLGSLSALGQHTHHAHTQSASVVGTVSMTIKSVNKKRPLISTTESGDLDEGDDDMNI